MDLLWVFIGLIQSQRPNCGYLELFWKKGPQMGGLEVALRGIGSNRTPLTSFFSPKQKLPPPTLAHKLHFKNILLLHLYWEIPKRHTFCRLYQ